MAAAKKKAKEPSVAQYLDNIADAGLRSDARVLFDLFQNVSRAEPKLWGGNIVGFGAYHYVTKGRQGDWCLTGFSPRNGTLTLFVVGGWEAHAELLAKVGQHALRGELLSIKRLADVNAPALKRLLTAAYKRAQQIAKDEARQQAKG